VFLGVTALPAQPKQTSEGTSTGSNITKNKYESSDLQTTKKPIINQEISRVGTLKKTHTQKTSENVGESTSNKINTQKISGNRTTEKPTKQNSSSSNKSGSNKNNNSTNISNKSKNSNTTSINISSSNKISTINDGRNSSSISSSNNSSIISTNSSSNSSSISINNSSIPKAVKVSLRTDSKDLALSSDLNSTNEVVKRSSAIKLFTIESEDTSKPIEIEVKTYNAPPNTSAIIEVRPKASNIYEIDVRNYPVENSWPVYQMYPYPQEINGPQGWYMQQYEQSLPSSLTYVPTEELLHGQSFSNTPGFNSQLLYQYPVKEAVHNKPTSFLKSKPSHVQHSFSKLLNNQAKISKPDPKDDYNLLPNYAVDPLPRISPYQVNTPVQFLNSLPQNYFPPYFLPHTNNIQAESNLNNKPAVTKYVTNSYVLKTHPKLEWVPV
jgi:hypothetical protein